MAQKKRVSPKEVRKFYGEVITPQNRRVMEKIFYHDFMKQISKSDDEKYENMKQEDKMRAARLFAKLECNREVKHYKAWRRRKTIYTYHGTVYKVLTEEPEIKGAKFFSEILEEE